jgi:hypothetical protein
MRFRSRGWTCAGALTAVLVMTTAPAAFAQTDASPAARVFATLFETPPLVPPLRPSPRVRHDVGSAAAPMRTLDVPRTPPARRSASAHDEHPAGTLLPALYVGFGVLQALDAHSTVRAVGAGHRERNPAMAPFVGNTGAMLAVKAATTAGTVYMAHRLGRRHRVAATVLMVAMNGAYAAIVASNYRLEVQGADDAPLTWPS